jgi:hypothetical protein
VLVSGGVAALNVLVGMIHERGWYRWWLIYAFALLDVFYVAILVVWFGHGGLVAAFFIAVLPYAFEQTRGVGDFLVLVASLTYLAASHVHGVLYPGTPGLDTGAFIETVAFILVAVGTDSRDVDRRIRHACSVMGEAEQGYLAVRAPATESDELGFLEKSFNRMLEEIGATISTVQREADEVAAFAEELAASAQQLHSTSEAVTLTAQECRCPPAAGLAEGARGESRARIRPARCAPAGDDAGRPPPRRRGVGERAARAARRCGPSARRFRPRRYRRGLSGMSTGSADSPGDRAIARQTQLLALNAAIEAPAPERGRLRGGRDEVRLTGAARSARGRELVTELRVDRRRRPRHADRRSKSGTSEHGRGDGAARCTRACLSRSVNATAEVSRSQAADWRSSPSDRSRSPISSAWSADGAARPPGPNTSMSDLTATAAARPVGRAVARQHRPLLGHAPRADHGRASRHHVGAPRVPHGHGSRHLTLGVTPPGRRSRRPILGPRHERSWGGTRGTSPGTG